MANAFNESNGEHQATENSTVVRFGEVSEITLQTQIANRVKRKAKRRGKALGLNGGDLNMEKPPESPTKVKAKTKDRHSRTGRRGLPKKGGAGGKGTWGKLVEVYDEGPAKDSNDPNYDSAEEEDYVVTPTLPEMSVNEFQQHGEEVIKEYLEHSDVDEVLTSLGEYNIYSFKHEIPRLAVTIAMEKKPAYRELISVLLSDMYGTLVNSKDMMKGFDVLLEEVEDLKLDTPDAGEVLGNFIARAVADDCLPPAYVTKNGVNSSTAREALKRAKLLLSMKHGLARLDNVWGVGGGQRPVMYLINKMKLLLREYLSSGDISEAYRCLQELDVPHFHHELVYEAVMTVLEDYNEHCLEMMSKLLQHMDKATIITSDQMKAGFRRIYDDMTEIVLDIPNGYSFLTKLVEKGEQYGFLPLEIVDELPQRGRKRFVSEGDGGTVKDPEY